MPPSAQPGVGACCTAACFGSPSADEMPRWLAAAGETELVQLAAHLRWLYDIVLREKVANSAFASRFMDRLCKDCQPLETHQGDARSLFARHHQLGQVLCDGALYVFAAEVVFNEVPPTVVHYFNSGGRREPPQTLSIVLRWLSNRHALSLGTTPLQDWSRALSCESKLRPDLHNVLCSFLLHHYCYSFIQPQDVIAHVASFAPPAAEGVVDDLEGALLLWVNKVCALFTSASGAAQPCDCAGGDLFEAIRDGRLLSIVFYKYDTSFLRLQSLELGTDLTPGQQVVNWSVLLDACRRSRINPPFSASEVVMHYGDLRRPMLWLVQMMHNVLRKSSEGILGGCPLLHEEQGGAQPLRPPSAAEADTAFRLRRPPSACARHAGHRYDPCDAASEAATCCGAPFSPAGGLLSPAEAGAPSCPSASPAPQLAPARSPAAAAECGGAAPGPAPGEGDCSESEEGEEEEEGKPDLFGAAAELGSGTYARGALQPRHAELLRIEVARGSPSDPLGIEFADPYGPPRVVAVREGLPTDKAGFTVGQLIVAVDGVAVHSGIDVAQMVLGRSTFEFTVAPPQAAECGTEAGVSFVRASMQLLQSPESSADDSAASGCGSGRATPAPPEELPSAPSSGCRLLPQAIGSGSERGAPSPEVRSPSGSSTSMSPPRGCEGGSAGGPSPPAAWTPSPPPEQLSPAAAAAAAGLSPARCPLPETPPAAAAASEGEPAAVAEAADCTSAGGGGAEEPRSAAASPAPTPPPAETAGAREWREAAAAGLAAAAQVVDSPDPFASLKCRSPDAAAEGGWDPAEGAAAAAMPPPQPAAAPPPSPGGADTAPEVLAAAEQAAGGDGGCGCCPSAGELRRSAATAATATSCRSDATDRGTAASEAAARCEADAASDGGCPTPRSPAGGEATAAHRTEQGAEEGAPAPYTDSPTPASAASQPSPVVTPCRSEGSFAAGATLPQAPAHAARSASSACPTPQGSARAMRIAGARPLVDLGFERAPGAATPPPAPSPPGRGGAAGLPPAPADPLAAENKRLDLEYNALVTQRDRVIERLRRRSARRAARGTAPDPAGTPSPPPQQQRDGEGGGGGSALRRLQRLPNPQEQPRGTPQPAAGKENVPPPCGAQRRGPSPPAAKDRRRDSPAGSDACGAAQLLMAARSRQHASNAIKHLCLPGKGVNAVAAAEVAAAMEAAMAEAGERQRELRFVLHLRAAAQPLLKSVYAALPDDGCLRRIYGNGPRRLQSNHAGIAAQCLRYDSGAKRFVELPGSFSAGDPLVDAVVLSKTY